MAASHNDSEHKRDFAQRWAKSTPAERRDMLRDERARRTPQTSRQAMILVCVLLTAAAIMALGKAISAGSPAVVIVAFVVMAVLCGAAAELARRGRTRVAFWAVILAALSASLVETFTR